MYERFRNLQPFFLSSIVHGCVVITFPSVPLSLVLGDVALVVFAIVLYDIHIQYVHIACSNTSVPSPRPFASGDVLRGMHLQR